MTRALYTEKKIGVYWGRFNPPHKGHMRMIMMLSRKYRLIVAIGSSEHKNEKKNPFSGAERKRMMESYLAEARIKGVKVVTLNDGKSMSWAIGNLIRKCKPDLLLLSTEKAEMIGLAKPHVKVEVFKRTGVSSTMIRDYIAAGSNKWKALTGRSVAKLITRFGGMQRIRRAYKQA